MARQEITQYLIYRWRYILGYTLVGLLLAGMLTFAGLFVPGGISAAEQESVVRSEALNVGDITSFAVPNVPYHLLQAASLEVFGVSEFTIKLPSLLLGLASAIGLILLLRRWFRPNIAVLASLIAVTTGQFVFIAQAGTPSIMYIFWPVVLLLLGTQITRASHHRLLWKVLFGIAVATSLYTPLSIYVLLAIAITISLHPHLRNAVRRLSKLKVASVTTLAGLIVVPLALAIIDRPSLGLTLLGLPTSWPIDLFANFTLQLRQYFIFWEPSATTLLTPVFGLGTLLLIGLGLYRLFKTRETTRSYLIITWIVALIPILVLNPSITSIVFIPAVLLLAAGLTSLIDYWYRLFPRNPYARIAGLIPLIVLVATLIGAGIDRYVYGYHYSPSIASNFSQDLGLLPKSKVQLVVSDDQTSFYRAVASYRPSLNVVTVPTESKILVTNKARPTIPADYRITRIITNTYANDGDRFYEYQKS